MTGRPETSDPGGGVVTIRLGVTAVHVVSGPTGAMVVDAGYPGQEESILKGLAGWNLAPEDVSLILISHGHLDHFGSAGALARACGAPVAVHTADADALRRGVNPPVTPTGNTGRVMKALLSRVSSARAPGLEPDIVFDEPPDLAQFGLDARLIHTPGHTPGSVSVVTPSGAAVIGDLLFGGLIRRSAPTRPWFADDLALWRQSLARVLELEPRRILAAHGGPFDPHRAAGLLR